MSEINEKRLYFVMINMIVFFSLSIAAFLFLFGECQNSNVEQRSIFFFIDLVAFIGALFASIELSKQLYN